MLAALNIDSELFPDRTRLHAIAWHLGDHIDAKKLHQDELILAGEFHPVGGGFCVVFRFGVLVTIDVDEEAAASLRKTLLTYTSGAATTPVREEATIDVSPEVEDTQRRSSMRLSADAGIPVRDTAVGRLYIIAEVLAKSAALAHHEERVGGVFERIEPLARAVQSGNARTGDKELLQLLGDATVTQTSTIGRMEVRDKPDVAWDHPDLDRLWRALCDEYELNERDAILSRKLALISSTTSTFYQLLQAHQTHRVEWYIVILIVIEIVIIVYEMFM